MVKHTIKLMNNMPFKERYCRIPSHQYEEVKKYLHEMLKIGAIWRSNSPWVSTVVLIRKKDSSLYFCIDLCKHNAHTMKDAYGLPRINIYASPLGLVVVDGSLHHIWLSKLCSQSNPCIILRGGGGCRGSTPYSSPSELCSQIYRHLQSHRFVGT